MANKGIAIILYTVREPAKQDLFGTLKRVRDCGFEYVQWSGMPAVHPEEARSALDNAGLKAVAGHCGIEPFESNFAQEVAFWKTLGANDIAPGGMMNDCRDTLEAWLKGADRLNALGERLRGEGIRLSYHNHDFELGKFEGDERCKLDILYESTDPRNLNAELDLAWVQVGGADPAAYIRKYAGRCPVIHCKDMKAERNASGRPIFAPLGQGCLDWDAIFTAAEEAKVEWCVYEQDSHEGDLWDCVRTSCEFLKQSIG